jgi:hypothetical protein
MSQYLWRSANILQQSHQQGATGNETAGSRNSEVV